MSLLLILNDAGTVYDVFSYRRTTLGPITHTYLDQAGSGPRSRAVIRLDWASICYRIAVSSSQCHEWSSIVFLSLSLLLKCGSPPGPTWRYLIRGSQSLIHQAYLLRSNSRNCYLRKNSARNSVTNRSHRFGSISNNCCSGARRQPLMPLCCENSSSNICHLMYEPHQQQLSV